MKNRVKRRSGRGRFAKKRHLALGGARKRLKRKRRRRTTVKQQQTRRSHRSMRRSTRSSKQKRTASRPRRSSNRRRHIAFRRRSKKTKRKIYRQEQPVQTDKPAKETAEEAYKKAYNHGYHTGYDKGFSKGHDTGIYDGGDKWVDAAMPADRMLPIASMQEIVSAGVTALEEQMVPLLSPYEVAGHLQTSLDNRRGTSVVRLGDGELLTMAQETVWPLDKIKQEGGFLPYAGVDVPDPVARDALVQAVREADIVGIPTLRLPNFQLLAISVFQACGLDMRQIRLTDSVINYSLHLSGLWPSLLKNRSVLLIGNKAQELAAVLEPKGVQITGLIPSVSGVHDADRIMHLAERESFDIALVSAGIAAVLICARIHRHLGRTAADFGHLADELIKGRTEFPFLTEA